MLRGASLTLLGTRVLRPVVVLIADGAGDIEAKATVLQIALARCRGCRRRWRLLPADVLPYKRYGLATIAAIASAHTEGNRSLRKAAWTTHTGQTPAHSTLHAWTEGLGAHMLGRSFGSLPAASAFGEMLAMTAVRWPVLLPAALPRPPIDPRRHRSEARRERLVAVAGVLKLAVSVLVAIGTTPPATSSAALCEWRRLTIEYGASPPCPTRTRSPPGDSSRSLPSSIPPSTSPAGEA